MTILHLNLSIVPPVRQSFDGEDSARQDSGAGRGRSESEPNSGRFLQVPEVGSPRSPTPLLPSPGRIPLTPRTKHVKEAVTAMEKERSPFEVIRSFCGKPIYQGCKPCLFKRIECQNPLNGQGACCCKGKDIKLHEYKGRIDCVKHCAGCLAILPCILLCIGTLGCSLKNETCIGCKPSSVAPAPQEMS